MISVDKSRPLTKDELELIRLQIRSERINFYVRYIVLLASAISAFFIYFDLTRPQGKESMGRERAKFMWEVHKEKDPESSAYGQKLIELVYPAQNDEFRAMDKKQNEGINDELEIKKQQLRRAIEESDDPIDRKTFELRLKTIEKMYE